MVIPRQPAARRRPFIAGPYMHPLRFSWLTRFYDPCFRWLMPEEEMRRRLARSAADGRPGTILDLGCGTGSLILHLARACPGARLVGVDGDLEALRTARRKLARAGVTATISRAMAQALPFSRRTFDVVASSMVFHHLRPGDKVAAFREALRVLRRNGRFLLMDFGPPLGRFPRLVFRVLQWLDGIANTEDNRTGRVLDLARAAGWPSPSRLWVRPCWFGTLYLWAFKGPAARVRRA